MFIFRTLKALRIYGCMVELRVSYANGRLTFRLTKALNNTGSFAGIANYLYLVYNNQQTLFALSEDQNSLEVACDYLGGLDSAELYIPDPASTKRIYYDGTYLGATMPVTWQIPYQIPTFSFATPSIHEDYDNILRWSITTPANIPCAVVEVLYYEQDDNADTYTCTKLSAVQNFTGQLVHHIAEGAMGKQCYYRLAYGSYMSESEDLDAYVTYGEYTTEGFTIGATAKYPNAPATITSNRPMIGEYANVVWASSEDGIHQIVRYELERQVNGGEWSQVYSGNSTSFSDLLTLAWAETLRYRVRSVEVSEYASDWTVSEEIAVLKSNVFVMTGGVLRPATKIYIGGYGEADPIAYMG